MAVENKLTEFRRAVWAAVNNHPPLRERFRLKLQFERRSRTAGVKDPTPRLIAPTNRTHLPCIAMFPARTPPRWADNRNLSLLYTLTIEVWTIGWYADIGESIWDDFIDAVYTCAPEDRPTVPYVRAVTENLIIEPITFRRGRMKEDSKVRVTQMSFGITAALNKSIEFNRTEE